MHQSAASQSSTIQVKRDKVVFSQKGPPKPLKMADDDVPVCEQSNMEPSLHQPLVSDFNPSE